MIIGSFLYGGLVVNHAELNGRSVLTNGLEKLWKYNPVTNKLLPAVLRPFRGKVALSLPNAVGDGKLSGKYVYRVVPYNQNEDEEGQGYPDAKENLDFVITTDQQSVLIDRTDLKKDNSETTHWRIYRTVGGGDWPVMFLVKTVKWATTTYTDDKEDPGEDSEDFIDHPFKYLIRVPRPKPYICQHGDRLFAIGDVPYSEGHAKVTHGSDRVQPVNPAVWGFHFEKKEFHVENDQRKYTIDAWDPDTNEFVLDDAYAGSTKGAADYRICGNPDEMIFTEPEKENQWPEANVCSVGGKEADKPTGILSDAGRILVTKSRRVYSVYGSSELWAGPYSKVSLISSQFGGLAHRTAIHINGVPHMASRLGIIAVAGNGVQLVSGNAQDWFRDELDFEADGTQQACFAVHWAAKKQYILFLKSKDAILGCDKALVYHYQDRKFSTFEFQTEFTCGSLVKDANGDDVIVLGDVNGYVWQFPYGDIDGAPAGIGLEGTVDAYNPVAPYRITDNDASFPMAGLGLAGIPVYIYEGTGAGQSNIVTSNTGTMLVFGNAFAVPLDATSKYRIGAIVAEYRTGWQDFGSVARVKKVFFAHLVFEQQAASRLRLKVYKDFDAANPPDLVDNRTQVDAGDISLNEANGRKRVDIGGIEGVHLGWGISDDRPNNPFSLYDLALRAEIKEK